ncbi:molybdenum ABC transporter ATP-binding protein [Caenimonas sp. SL110]|uniref:molybdenum ABC transporter ATP-binding protein n=1 Tax=Caenimonas sp. SL110 TaxID=1450524 RepID=UPI00069E07D2|nr:molybdenum ABC transporter ATP-binding protein [Caenimonas sp. SL110]
MTAQPNCVQVTLVRPAFTLHASFEPPVRGITAIFGASGSGKTTLLRCIAGLERAHDAVVRIAGRTWQDDSRKLFVPVWQRPIGYVFQEASLFDHLDVRGNLAFADKRASGVDRKQVALDEAIDLLGIAHLLRRRTHELSGGERQRVAIARALASQPQLLLLDEPLASLDHARRQEILPWLERLRDELHIPMLYVTHAADEVARLADTLVVLELGVVKASGPTGEVLARIDSPVVVGDDAGALLEGRVEERDERWHLMRVGFAGGSLWLRDSGLPVGQAVRMRVLARDVSVALETPQASSIQNVLPCTIEAMAPDAHPSQVMLRLTVGKASLLARITARAADALSLAPGQQVWAQVKSAALVG